MEKSTFVYVTYIRTTPKKLWRALITPEFQRQYWNGMHWESDWKAGSPWKMLFPDGQIADNGTIVESRPPKRLVMRWRNEWDRALKSEGFSLCTMELKPMTDSVKLTITHTIDRPKSKLINAVSGGWPFVLSNLKSLLETKKIAIKEYRHRRT